MHLTLLISGEVSCWKGLALLLQERPGFSVIHYDPGLASNLRPMQQLAAKVNGAFPSLPLSLRTRRSCWSGGPLNSKAKELCPQQLWYSSMQRDLPQLPSHPQHMLPLIWPHWRVSTDAWHIHSQGSRPPRLLAGYCLMMIQSWATAWVIVSGMVGKRPWQDQRGKMLRVGCLLSRGPWKGESGMWEGWQKKSVSLVLWL